MPHLPRPLHTLAILASTLATVATTGAALTTPPARASTTQQTVLQDDTQLRTNLAGTLATMHELGAGVIRVAVYWNSLAPQPRSSKAPKHFNGGNPAAYPAAGWAFYDNLVRQAAADGLRIDMMLTGPGPIWAAGPGMPHTSNCPCGQWKPSPTAFQAFVRAVGTRYSGHYAPSGASTTLPRVSFWAIWNEPNYGPDLAPQAIDHDRIEVGAVEYRGLLDAAWKGLSASGHRPGTDTILIGETAPRGLNHPIGNFSGDKPLRFLRALYCVGANYKPLRGTAAGQRSCPTTAAGSRAFRAQHPALFSASGFAAHPYAQGVAPNKPTYACGARVCTNGANRSDPDYADLPELPRLERALDRMNGVYGSRTRFPIWNTEYGYWTNPPDPAATINQQTAAAYMNWAEYLSYRQPRIASYSQYLIVDPPNGNFASGLELPDGTPKATYAAFALPLYMPVTRAGHATSLEVWGCMRTHFSLVPGALTAQVQIQFAPATSGVFQTVQTVDVTNPRGYFDVHQAFTQSGQVRLVMVGAPFAVSRTVAISVR
jgi:hypothetical protein